MRFAFFDTSLNVCTWTEAKTKVFCFIKMKLRAPFKRFKPVSSCTQHLKFPSISDYTGQLSHGDVMHHHNGLRPETSCILWSCCSTEESFRFKSCLSAVRMWCTTLSQDPPKNKSEKRSRNVRNAPCQPLFAPRAYRADVSNWRAPSNDRQDQRGVGCDVHDKQHFETMGGSVATKYGLVTKHETVLVLADLPHARNVPFSYVGG